MEFGPTKKNKYLMTARLEIINENHCSRLGMQNFDEVVIYGLVWIFQRSITPSYRRPSLNWSHI